MIGASYCEFGTSKVACYVLCPRALTKATSVVPSVDVGVFDCEVSVAGHVVDESGRGGLDRAGYERKLSHWTQQALGSAVLLQYYPKQLVTLSIMVLQSSKHDFAAAVNAGTLAMADAGIHLTDLPCSAMLSRLNEGRAGSAKQLNESMHADSSHVTCAELPVLRKTTNMAVEGRLGARDLEACQHELHSSCLHIRNIMWKCLEAKLRSS